MAAERYRRAQSVSQGGLCPYCSHKRVSPGYNLRTVYPEVAAQWDYENNGALIPEEVSPASQRKVFWRCAFDPSHTWMDRVSNRTQLLRGCPICSRHFHISYAARAIYYYLRQNQIFCACEVPVGRYRIDIEIDQEGATPIALEIDGYRHRTPEAAERDARKDVFLKERGYRVVRVKEVPGLSEGIRLEGETILYPYSERNLYLDRVIGYLLLLIAGSHVDVDHVRDHWEIEEFYYHSRKERSLAVQYPALAKEWSDRNGERPGAVSPGLGVKRWWKCSQCGREYQATVYNRAHNGSACPYCAHLRVTPETCLAAVRPDVAAEWDDEKNAPLKPTDVLPGTDKRVWWKCEKGHSWRAAICMRTGSKGTKCPFCQGHAVEESASLAKKSPALAQYWHPFKNTLPPEKVAPHSNKVFWWRCPKGHEWQDMPNRLQKYPPERVCPYCDHRRLSEEYSLAAQNPQLAAFWHPARNALTPGSIAPFSNKKVWWRCEKGHEWQESVGQMQIFGAERACPYCSDRKVWEGNSLAYLAPELAAEWHPTKNLPVTAESIFPWSAKLVWWQCKMGHEWKTTPEKRYRRGDGCPYCSGRRVAPERSLAVLKPELLGEWDSARNLPLAADKVAAYGRRRVWWKCVRGHSWQATPAARSRGGECPICAKEKRESEI